MRSVALLLLLLSTGSGAAPAEQEVDYLISFVADSGCDFYRNNSLHDSVSAADHLRTKYRNGRRWVNSAEQFIDRIATGSSITGRPYRVNCEGAEMSSGDWLHQALARHRADMASAQ
jgi:hypothetical protein